MNFSSLGSSTFIKTNKIRKLRTNMCWKLRQLFFLRSNVRQSIHGSYLTLSYLPILPRYYNFLFIIDKLMVTYQPVLKWVFFKINKRRRDRLFFNSGQHFELKKRIFNVKYFLNVSIKNYIIRWHACLSQSDRRLNKRA